MRRCLAVLLLGSLGLWGCGTDKASQVTTNADTRSPDTGSTPRESSAAEMAREISVDVGTVKKSSSADGARIVVFDERHDSRIGQLQHALMLSRLHDRYGLTDIVLEGFLKERPNLNTDWFTRSVRPETPEARAAVSVRFLAQGDISGAEFVKLVYPDVRVHQAEKSDHYYIQQPETLSAIDYLEKIARIDPAWAEERIKKVESVESFQAMSGGEKVRWAKEIKDYAETHRIAMPAKAKQQMDQYIAFMETRIGSNETIVETVDAVVKDPGVKVVAVNIGADHTEDMAQRLEQQRRAFAVISPKYGPAKAGGYSEVMYARKSKRLPVFATGVSALVLNQVASRIKPEPVTAEAWFEAEAELYGYVSSLAERALNPPTPPGPPPGGPKPPFGFNDDDFRGKWISVSLPAVEYLADADRRRGALLIPVKFNRTNRVVWVGTVNVRGQEQAQSTVEAILTQALQAVQSQTDTPTRAEDKTGKVQMGRNAFRWGSAGTR